MLKISRIKGSIKYRIRKVEQIIKVPIEYGIRKTGPIIDYLLNKLYVSDKDRKKVAIIMIGEIRISTEGQIKRWNELKDILKLYNVYISTYRRYENLAKEVTSKTFILENQNINSLDYMNIPSNGIYSKRAREFLWQSIFLSKVVQKYYSELNEYEIIIKIRNDTIFDLSSIVRKIKYNNYIYMATDWCFGAKSDLFMRMFYENDYLNYAKKIYGHDEDYISINYKNLLDTLLNLSRSYSSDIINRYCKWHTINYKHIQKVNLSNVIDLCRKNMNDDQPSIDSFRIEKCSTITKKPLKTLFAPEKNIVIYFLFFSPIRVFRCNIIRDPRNIRSKKPNDTTK